jgi:hypothetical protein
MKQREIFNGNKLRQTVLYGIPCNFIDHKTGKWNNSDEINIRAEVWKHITNLVSLKDKFLEDF